MSQNRSRLRDHVSRFHAILLAIYALLTIVLTWPLTRRITTHVAGNGIDDPALAWNMWWIKARLVDQLDFDIFHADWMFFPIDINLGFYTLTPLNGLPSIPLQTAFSLIFSSNILLFLSFILGGYGTFLLVLHVLSQSPRTNLFDIRCAAVVAGIIYAFASSKLFYASLGQFNIASSYWIPFCVLYLLRIDSSSKSRTRNACLAGLFLVFQAWAELTYASFLLIFIAIYFLWLQVRSQSTANRLALLGNFVVMGLLFVIGLAPFLWAMIPDMLVEGDFFASGGGFADTYSADLFGYLVPTIAHPIWGKWVETFPFDKALAQHIYIGYVALSLALLGVLVHLRNKRTTSGRPPAPQPTLQPNTNPPNTEYRPTEYRFWLFNLLIFWLLTLGPILRWRGENVEIAGVPLYGPFALISQLPFFSGNRYPSRYSVMLMLCVAILAAIGIAWLLNQLPIIRRARLRNGFVIAICSIVGVLFLAEHLSIPLAINYSITPPIYETIRDTPGDFTVLELPTGWRNGAYVLGKSDELIMMQQWYQSVHGKRRLGGNTSRNPSYKFEYFVNAPLIGDLIGLMNADRDHFVPVVESELPALIARNKEVAPKVLDFLNVRFITVDLARTPLALQEFVDAALPVTLLEEWTGEDWAGKPQTIRLYAVADPSMDPQAEQGGNGWTIRLSDEDSSLYLAEGWSALADDQKNVRYAVRPQAELLLDIDGAGGRLIVERGGQNEATGLPLELTLNGVPLAVDVAADGRLIADVPAHVASAPVDRLRLDFPQEGVAARAVSDVAPLSIVAMSAGQENGDYARLYINGDDVSLNQLGYNLAAVTPSGELLESVVFDTHNSPATPKPSAAMAEWLGKWPAGTLIAGAVRDTAGYQLEEDALNALKQIGVFADLRGTLRWNHAFIGVAGGTQVAGLPLEEAGLLNPAALSFGSSVSAKAHYGSIYSIRFDPAP